MPSFDRRRLREAHGFTLIELLVVILIIGILAAIAIPSFLGQREKAAITAAKSTAKSAYTAARTYYTQHESYDGMTVAKLVEIEPTLADANWVSGWCRSAGDPYVYGRGEEFCVGIAAKTSRRSWWAYTRNVNYDRDKDLRECTPAGRDGCTLRSGPVRAYWGW